MKNTVLRICSGVLILLGLSGIVLLALPQTRVHTQPSWVVAASTLNILITGIGFWRKRKWAPIVFAPLWIAQFTALLVMSLPIRPGAGLVGAAMIALLSFIYWDDLT
jgi:hypothetical protein